MTTPPPTPAPTSGVNAAQVAKDVTTYGGVVIAILSILANVPAFHSVFNATGSVQGVVDALCAVVTAIFSIKKQQATAALAAKAAALRQMVR